MRRKVERGYKRKGPTVPPTPEQLWRKVCELNIDIGLACDVETRRIVWDTSVDLTAAVDALGVYRATGLITKRHERAGRLYAMGRRATFGGAFPFGVSLARMVASSLPQDDEQAEQFGKWDELTDEDRHKRQVWLEESYRAADRFLIATAGAVVRAIVRVVLVDSDKLPGRDEVHLVRGLETLARFWCIQDDDEEED